MDLENTLNYFRELIKDRVKYEVMTMSVVRYVCVTTTRSQEYVLEKLKTMFGDQKFSVFKTQQGVRERIYINTTVKFTPRKTSAIPVIDNRTGEKYPSITECARVNYISMPALEKILYHSIDGRYSLVKTKTA